ncbi:acyl-CoA dehydrogenase family protein [Micromonospora sp. NPDC050980]|uniref:acyl-CoA dehydrogenase family protein n=1 Tax=Micromonospora sp. NPDC050980 TaxID=3155161 RepID=UPI0033F8B967
MTLTSPVVERAASRPPEPGLTPADLVARAEAMAPTLVARQAETEERTYYAEDTHRAFAEAGFYRITVPRRYGGYEFGFDTFLRVAMTLARACPSTGWMYCLGAAHSLVAATLFSESAQEEMFRQGDFIAPAVVAPGGTARRTPEGDWVLDGVWRYCSGAPYATHLIGHALVDDQDGAPPRPLLFVAPRDRWRLLDDWGAQLGLRGSGSHSIAIENGRIPGHFGLDGTHLSEISVVGGTPGRALHEHPQYGGAPLSSMALEGAAIGVAMAQGALDAYAELMTTRTTMFPPFARRVEDPDYQRWYAQADGMIVGAEAAFRDATRQWHELCAGDPAEFTLERDLRIALICREAAELAWRAVEQVIQPTAGTSAVKAGERLERVWRDLSTAHTHAGFAVLLTTAAGRMYTQARFAAELSGGQPA